MKVKRLPLRAQDGSIRAYAVIDADDYPLVRDSRWSLTANGYVARGSELDPHLLHRLIMGLYRGDRREVDHINHDRLDNRRANLRVLTLAENRQNVPSRAGTSKHRGVCWSREHGRWRAYARVDGKQHHLGLFENAEEAAAVAREFRATHMAGAVD